VALFPHQPAPEVLTYATLGLSHHLLALREGRCVRQEFVLALHERFGQDSLAALLLHVAEDVLGRHRALLRGEVLPLGAPLVSQSAATDLYATLPVVFPDSFATFSDTSPPTVFVWLVPIMREESRFIQAHGWSEFETLLEQSEVDLFDLARPSVA
jgi:hypothetical protein